MKPNSIDDYIAFASPSAKPILKKIRQVVHAAAPRAEEVISYRMPAFRMNGILIYFAAFKNHIGFYPPVVGDPTLMKAVIPYAGPKGNLKFPLDKPIPYDLIKKIVRYRVKQNMSKSPNKFVGAA
jgi:uncharacterized protein YdhG (YjbR/CyaY superfamily)